MDFQHLLNDQSGTPRKLTYPFKNDGCKHAFPFEMVIFFGGGTFVTFGGVSSWWLNHPNWKTYARQIGSLSPSFRGENQTSLEFPPAINREFLIMGI